MGDHHGGRGHLQGQKGENVKKIHKPHDVLKPDRPACPVCKSTRAEHEGGCPYQLP